MPRASSVALLLVALLLAPATARADAIDPDEEACWDKAVGDACTLPYDGGGSGACVESTCSRNDYSVDENGEVEVGVIEEPCLVCEEGATPTRSPGFMARFARCSLYGVAEQRGVLPLASLLLGAVLLVALHRRRSRR